MVEQVGGDHYQADYQHWDWAAETGLGCLEYAASKYITRWRKKDGVQGLKKAITYLQKIKEMGITVCTPAFDRPKRAIHRFGRFARSNGIDSASKDFQVLVIIDTWDTHEELDLAISLLKEMIDEQGS